MTTGTSPTGAQDGDWRVRLDGLFEPFNRSDAPGLVVGVAWQGRTVYRRGLGLASLELGVANQPGTRMRIGSTSKHFAALAALLLAEAGRLDLDAPARRLIPELPDELGEPTLRQFMNHTSGMRDYLDMGLLTSGPAMQPRGTALDVQTSHRARNFRPGEKATYNNGGYHLLAVAIDRAAGVPFEVFVRQQIFEPLGLHDTTWSASDLDVNRGMASLYLPDMAGGWRKGMFPSEEVRAEGGMVSTVDDLLRWLAHLRSDEKKIGRTSSWAQMVQPARLDNGTTVPYGLGLMMGRYRGAETIHHAGNVFGGACQMLTLPAHGLDIVLITNGALVSPVDLAEKVVDAVLGDVLPPPQPPSASGPLASLVGKTYGSDSTGALVSFADAGGALAAAVFNGPPLPLFEAPSDTGGQVRLLLPFEKVVAGPFVFALGPADGLADSAPRSFTWFEGGHAETLTLLDAAPTAAAIAADLIGDYDVQGLDATAQLRLHGDALELRLSGRFGAVPLVITPVSFTLCTWVFGLPSLPLRGSLRIERPPGARPVLRLDTLRTRGLTLTPRTG